MVIAEAAHLLHREIAPHAEAARYRSIIDGDLSVETLTRPDWAPIAELVVDIGPLVAVANRDDAHTRADQACVPGYGHPNAAVGRDRA